MTNDLDLEDALGVQLPGRRTRRAGIVSFVTSLASCLALGLAARTSFGTLFAGLALGVLGALAAVVSLLSGLAALVLARAVARDASAREREDRRWGLAFGLAGPAITALAWSLLLTQ